MIARTLSRYFGLAFLRALIGVFVGVLLLVTLIDYIEMMRRSAGEREDSTAQPSAGCILSALKSRSES